MSSLKIASHRMTCDMAEVMAAEIPLLNGSALVQWSPPFLRSWWVSSSVLTLHQSGVGSPCGLYAGSTPLHHFFHATSRLPFSSMSSCPSEKGKSGSFCLPVTFRVSSSSILCNRICSIFNEESIHLIADEDLREGVSERSVSPFLEWFGTGKTTIAIPHTIMRFFFCSHTPGKRGRITIPRMTRRSNPCSMTTRAHSGH